MTALFRACFFAVFFAAVALRSTVSVDRYGQLRIRCPSRSAQGHRPYKSYILLKNVITGVFLCLRKVVYSAAGFTLTALFRACFFAVFFAAVALRSTVSVDRYGQLRIRCPSRSAQGHRPYKSYILLKNVITGVFLCLRKVVYSAASFFDRAFSGVFFCGVTPSFSLCLCSFRGLLMPSRGS